MSCFIFHQVGHVENFWLFLHLRNRGRAPARYFLGPPEKAWLERSRRDTPHVLRRGCGCVPAHAKLARRCRGPVPIFDRRSPPARPERARRRAEGEAVSVGGGDDHHGERPMARRRRRSVAGQAVRRRRRAVERPRRRSAQLCQLLGGSLEGRLQPRDRSWVGRVMGWMARGRAAQMHLCSNFDVRFVVCVACCRSCMLLTGR